MSLSRKLTKIVANYDNKNSFVSKLRKERIELFLLPLLRKCYEIHGKINLIDIGGTKEYWEIIGTTLLEELNVHITILNLVNVNKSDESDRFSFVEGDGCDLTMFNDNSFHIAHSNSVVEHVGNWERMNQFAHEIDRVSDYYFVQTPNYWFPIEPHCMTPFFHWLPKPMRIWLVMRFNLGNWRKAKDTSAAVTVIERSRLLNKKMLRALFKDAEIVAEKFIGLPKSLIAVKSNP